MRILTNCLLLFGVFSFSKPIKSPEMPHLEPLKEKVVLDTTRTVINDLHILHPAFRNKVITLLYECKKKGITLKVVETYRTYERQDKMKRIKRSMLSGGHSKHQHYLAVDLVPIINGKAQWHNKKLWNVVIKEAEKLDLVCGGKWKMRDYNHFEYKVKLDSIHTIPIPDTVIIPLE